MESASPDRSITRAWYQIHFCVLLWGLTAILGKLISLSAVSLVWWRMSIVALALLTIPRTWRGLAAMPRRLIAIYLGIGALVGLHWLAFYGAVKLANASVAASTLALGPVFVAFIEPWVLRRRLNPAELLLGVAVVPGVALVVGGTPDAMRSGLWLGVLAAVLVALFGSLNKRYVMRANSFSMTCLEMAGGVLVVSALLPSLSTAQSFFTLPNDRDLVRLLVLCFGCTLLPFALALVALRHLTAFGTQLALNLEPVYAIVLSIVLLGEQRELSARFYFGAAIIFAAVFIYPLLQRPMQSKPAVSA